MTEAQGETIIAALTYLVAAEPYIRHLLEVAVYALCWCAASLTLRNCVLGKNQEYVV